MYSKVVNDAIDYIREHMDEDLTVEEIANHCHFSKYYFNRLFKSQVGESLYAFIKRMRIEKSAFRMRYETDNSITGIAADFGYSSSNFSSAFKNRYGVSPIRFKRSLANSEILRIENRYYADLRNKDVTYYDKHMARVHLDDFKVIYKRYIGDYHQQPQYRRDFLEHYKDYIEDDSWLIDISYDDPTTTETNRLITDMCLTTNRPIGDDCLEMDIKGGYYMIYSFKGPPWHIYETYQGLFGIWMPGTDYQIDYKNRKMLNHYIYINDRDKYIEMDIYIPII